MLVLFRMTTSPARAQISTPGRARCMLSRVRFRHIVSTNGSVSCACVGCGRPSASSSGAHVSAFFSATLSGTADTHVVSGVVVLNCHRTCRLVMQRGW